VEKDWVNRFNFREWKPWVRWLVGIVLFFPGPFGVSWKIWVPVASLRGIVAGLCIRAYFKAGYDYLHEGTDTKATCKSCGAIMSSVDILTHLCQK
jgi:hypothetical protein